MAALGSALRTNTTIGALNLYSNKLGDSNVVPLLEALRDNRTLTSLSLGDNGLTSDWCVPVCADCTAVVCLRVCVCVAVAVAVCVRFRR